MRIFVLGDQILTLHSVLFNMIFAINLIPPSDFGAVIEISTYISMFIVAIYRLLIDNINIKCNTNTLVDGS